MQKSYFFNFFFISTIIFVSLTACAPQPTASISPTQAIILESYRTPTIAPSPTPMPIEVQPTIPPLPTATPFQYSIQSGDTLLGIALKFGVTLDELYLANPSIDPNILSIGQSLSIPESNSIQNNPSVLSAEILPLDLSTPICYPSSTNGNWCFVKIQNNTQQFAENISLAIYLYDNAGNLITNQIITPPSNILPSQKSTIAGHYFNNISQIGSVNSTLTTAISSQNNSSRYISSTFSQSNLLISDNKMSATLQGTLEHQTMPSSYSWVIALAFDQNGNPVGYRQWESTQLSQNIAVDMKIYSAGGAIHSVEILTEAR